MCGVSRLVFREGVGAEARARTETAAGLQGAEPLAGGRMQVREIGKMDP